MTRAVIADTLGPIENYTLRSYDPGPPKPNQIRIAIKASGVSFVDVLTAEGKYQLQPPLPFIPGSECAGVIEAIGADVKNFSVGQKVAASSWGGIFADAVNVQATSANPIPECMTFEEAAVFPPSYSTVWHALVDRGQLRAGETLLVLGAGGATGYAAVQIGKHLGARVIASASSEAKRAMTLKGGADAAIDSRSETWRKDVLAANGGKPVDVVFDGVGGRATEPAFRSLALNGRHLIVGFPDGIASLATNLPLLKGASLIGVNLRAFGESDPKSAFANIQAVFALAAKGILKPVVAKTFPLERFAEAMAEAGKSQTAGRIAFVMG